MSKVLVLYHSAYGHIEAMAEAVAVSVPSSETLPVASPSSPFETDWEMPSALAAS